MQNVSMIVALILALVPNVVATFLRGQQQYANNNHLLHHPHTNSLTIPSACLEDPENPECHRLLREHQAFEIPSALLYGTDAFVKQKEALLDGGKPTLSPTTIYAYDFVYDDSRVATQSPTRDMCYGNMARLAYSKFCNSEMPSVSLEPSEVPTIYPQGGDLGGAEGNETTTATPTTPVPSVADDSGDITLEPSLEPTAVLYPSIIPTSPTVSPYTQEPIAITTESPGLGPCEGDCNVPSDCAEGLYCHQRSPYESVPGCPNSELDGSRTDYCTDIQHIPPAPAPTTNSFRLKLYWNSSYWWQESNDEVEWCMTCQQPTSCQVGESLSIHECGWDSVYLDFVEPENDDQDETNDNELDHWFIQVTDSNLCLERNNTTSAVLEICNSTNPLQQWNAPVGNVTEGSQFEIGQHPHHDMEWWCLTTHHHPKHGEEVELYPCSVARKDNTSFWGKF